MNVNKGFKYRINPNSSQIELINKTFGCCRFVYNESLNYRDNEYKLNANKNVNYYTCANLMSKIKHLEEYSWLKDVDATALQNAIKHMESAYKAFFNKNASFPKYKSKRNNVQSYTSTNNLGCIHLIDDKHIRLPKLGSVRIKFHRSLPKNCKINNATVSRRNNKYYVSLSVEYEIEDDNRSLNINNSIGLDYSSEHFAITSDKDYIDLPHFFRIYEAKLNRENRKLSKMKVHSNNWWKQKTKVFTIQEKISNSRLDVLHKLSKNIVSNYDIILLEDINLKNIAMSLKLGKSTNDNGFGMFRNFLEYKSLENGNIVQKVDKFFPSSKLCHNCGYKKIDLTLKDRVWTCPNCGTILDRDVNAAINIKNEGLRLLTVGTTGLARLGLTH